MPITEKQRQERKKHIGSSDMAAILGFDKWRNAYDVYLEKTGKLDDNDNADDKPWLGAGNYLEESILHWAADRLGEIRTEENGEALFRKAIGFHLATHPDGELISSGDPVEAKTAGLFGPLPDEWGVDDSDEVADRVIIQCHVHMICMDKRVCHVPTFLGGRGFAMFKVDWNDVVANTIMDKSSEFWDEHVVKDIPPPDIMPSYEMARKLHREPGKTIEIPDAVVTNWLNAKESAKTAKSIEEGANTEILVLLGDAEAATCGLGMITFMEQSATRIDAKKLRADAPVIAAEYSKTTISRVLRFKKPKKPKY